MTTTEESIVRILIVDDEPDRHQALLLQFESRAEIQVRDPSEVEVSDLEHADLISVDEYLGIRWEEFISSTNTSRSVFNLDGLSVAASFRSQQRSGGYSSAVCVHTGDLEKLAPDLPDHPREALTAAQHDLDWVFAWGSNDFGAKLLSLAAAVGSVRKNVESLGGDFGFSWLSGSSGRWQDLAIRQIEECRPPAHAIAVSTGGTAYVRWLAQKILPYPTFLYDDFHAANYLGLTVRSLEQMSSHPLVVEIGAVYDGPLSSFSGRRWWRAALEALLESCGVDEWESSGDRANALSSHMDLELQPLDTEAGVVVYSSSGKVDGVGCDPKNAIRMHADGWPAYADDQWMRIEDIQDDLSLQSQISGIDRGRFRRVLEDEA